MKSFAGKLERKCHEHVYFLLSLSLVPKFKSFKYPRLKQFVSNHIASTKAECLSALSWPQDAVKPKRFHGAA